MVNKIRYKTYNDNIIIEGKRYRWSGEIDSLYTTLTWYKHLCKIVKIDLENKYVLIYDYSDNQELKYSFDNLEKCKVIFDNWFSIW